MFATNLICKNCHKQFPLDVRYSCDDCGGLLEVEYDRAQLLNPDHILNPNKAFEGLWKYHRMLPVKNIQNIVTLGEGNTPVISAEHIAKIYKLPARIYLKAEMLNPSGSFKDRPSSVGVSVAKEQGFQSVAVASSGNASAAVSAYAARAGMRCNVFIPANTDPAKIMQAQAYGATVYAVDGTFSDAYAMSLEYSKQYGCPNCTSTYVNPYTVEADKTIAYELFHQMGNALPDYITIPIGTGPLLTGIYKGFQELFAMDLIQKLPKMVGVQCEECMPITKAFLTSDSGVKPWLAPIHTVAGGIADPLVGYEADGAETLKIVRASGGTMVALSEEEILEANRAVEQGVGLYSEPTGAVSVGAVKKLVDTGLAPADASFLCLTTGHGFKFTKRKFPFPPVIQSIHEINA